MKKYTQEEINELIQYNEKLDSLGEGMKLYLPGANLRDIDFSYKNLKYADFRGTDLRGSDFKGANLYKANFNGANMNEVNFRGANSCNADFKGANLRESNLRGVDFKGADFRFADLRGTDMSLSNLSDVELSYAKTDKRYIQIGCIGSKKRKTTYCFEDDIIWCGWFAGSLQEFENRIKEEHKDNPQYLKEYMGAIEYIKSLK